MKGRYYIIIFDKNETGEQIRHELNHVPNGTCFINSPIHISTKEEIIVTWAINGAEKYNDLAGLTIIPTNKTNRMSLIQIAKGLGVSPNDITRKNEKINKFFVNIFKDYVPNFDLN